MTITLTTLSWVPPMAIGLVRDLRVRWALEEAGRPYQVRLVSQEDKATPAYRQQQPFGQVPVYQEDGLTLFESGAILHHIAHSVPALMPADADGRAQTLSWMFAALNSIEPHTQNLASLDFFFSDEEGAVPRRARLEQMANGRLADLNNWLRDRDYLTGRFTVADILMATVLNMVRHTGLLQQHPALQAYHQRCIARPAYAKALAAQQAVYAAAPTAAG